MILMTTIAKMGEISKPPNTLGGSTLRMGARIGTVMFLNAETHGFREETQPKRTAQEISTSKIMRSTSISRRSAMMKNRFIGGRKYKVNSRQISLHFALYTLVVCLRGSILGIFLRPFPGLEAKFQVSRLL